MRPIVQIRNGIARLSSDWHRSAPKRLWCQARSLKAWLRFCGKIEPVFFDQIRNSSSDPSSSLVLSLIHFSIKANAALLSGGDSWSKLPGGVGDKTATGFPSSTITYGTWSSRTARIISAACVSISCTVTWGTVRLLSRTYQNTRSNSYHSSMLVGQCQAKNEIGEKLG